MSTKFLPFLFVVVSCFLSEAQDFWLLPQKFQFEIGEELVVGFVQGNNFEPEPWKITQEDIAKVEMITRTAGKDLVTQVDYSSKRNLVLKVQQLGIHLLAMQTKGENVEWTADAFNSYLEEQGLDQVLDERRQAGLSNRPVKEAYSCYTKLLVQSGDRVDDTYSKNVGQELEIIPVQNPYSLKSGDYMTCQVLYNGIPSPHTLVKVWSHVGNRIFLQNIFTENDGAIVFPVSNAGAWMVTAVIMKPSVREGIDWESLRSSLVFGIGN